MIFSSLGPNKHQSAVTCLQFNSKFVVTSSDDGTVKLWDVKTGKKCCVREGVKTPSHGKCPLGGYPDNGQDFSVKLAKKT